MNAENKITFDAINCGEWQMTFYRDTKVQEGNDERNK